MPAGIVADALLHVTARPGEFKGGLSRHGAAAKLRKMVQIGERGAIPAGRTGCQ